MCPRCISCPSEEIHFTRLKVANCEDGDRHRHCEVAIGHPRTVHTNPKPLTLKPLCYTVTEKSIVTSRRSSDHTHTSPPFLEQTKWRKANTYTTFQHYRPCEHTPTDPPAMSISPTTVIVTGASRGLGLELVRSLVTSPPVEPIMVYACCRSPANVKPSPPIKPASNASIEVCLSLSTLYHPPF